LVCVSKSNLQAEQSTSSHTRDLASTATRRGSSHYIEATRTHIDDKRWHPIRSCPLLFHPNPRYTMVGGEGCAQKVETDAASHGQMRRRPRTCRRCRGGLRTQTSTHSLLRCKRERWTNGGGGTGQRYLCALLRVRSRLVVDGYKLMRMEERVQQAVPEPRAADDAPKEGPRL
jgi:hypothetical protein